MTSAQALSGLALRRLFRPSPGPDAESGFGGAVVAPGPHVARALRRANAKAWFALELLVASGDLLKLLQSGDDRSRELQAALQALIQVAGPFPGERVRPTLEALHSATEAGVLTGGNLDPGAILPPLEGAADAASETQTLIRVADDLERQGFGELRFLLSLRTEPRDEPLPVALVAAIFRSAVETTPDLFDDLSPLLKAESEPDLARFNGVVAVISREGAWIESLLEEARREQRQGNVASVPAPAEPAMPPAATDAPGHLLRGEQHARRGEYDLAIAEFTAALRSDPDLSAAYTSRGDAMRLRGEFGPALADLECALRLVPGDTRALLTRGLVHAQSGRHAEAVNDFTAVVERAPTAGAFNHRGTSRAALGDYQGAIDDFTEALRLEPSSPWALYNLGEAHLSQREYVAAIGDFSNALRANPLFTLGHVRRADAYYRNGELNRAIADYTSALRLDPHNVHAFLYRGIAHKKRGRYDEALADFQAATQLDPNNAEIYLQRGLTFRLKDDPELALAAFDIAVRLAPDNPEVYYQRGLTYDAIGRREQALTDLTRTIELAPDHVAAFNSRGTLYLAIGDLTRADADFSEALRLDPEFALAYLNRATVRSKGGRFEESIADSDEALRRDASLTSAYLVRGSVYAQTERYGPALADFSEVLKRDPENDQAFYLRGVVRSKQGDYTAARVDLDEALRLDPSNARAYAFRGLSHQALKQTESAVVDFANAVRLDSKYAAAYCNQRAALHADRGELELAVADYSLLLALDPTNADAKSARDKALRALLARPAVRPETKTAPVIAPVVRAKEAEPAAPVLAAPAPTKEQAAPAAPKPRVRERPKAPATAVMPRASEPEPLPVVALPEVPDVPAAEDSSPDFVLNTSAETAVELDLANEPPAPVGRIAAIATAAADASGSESSGELLLSEPDSEEELSRQEKLEEERRADEAKAEQAARLQKLAAERQRMLDEVRKKREEMSRAKRVAKRNQGNKNDEEGTPWLQWGMRAAVAAAIIWGCFWVYDLIFGNTISHPSCYPFHGSVKFADGRPVNGGVLLLVQGTDEHEADIQPDGTFQTKTYSNQGFDGLPAGEYKIFLAPSSLNQEPVPPQYLKGGETPWIVRVNRQDNVVDLVVR